MRTGAHALPISGSASSLTPPPRYIPPPVREVCIGWHRSLSIQNASGTGMRARPRAMCTPSLVSASRYGIIIFFYPHLSLDFQLYTGHPPFSELSQAAALLRIVNGERPGRPSTSPALSAALWQHVTAYWAEDAAARPPIDVVVQEMAWPSPRRNRKSSRSLPSIPLAQSTPSPIPVSRLPRIPGTRPPPLPPIPLVRPAPLPPIPIVRSTPLPTIPASPSASSSLSSPSSLPVYFTPKGSPPGYNAPEYQRVDLSPSKMVQMEKASEQGPSRELDLGHIMKLLDKASERSMRDQTVVLSGGIETLVERARQRDLAKVRSDNFLSPTCIKYHLAAGSCGGVGTFLGCGEASFTRCGSAAHVEESG